MDSFGLDVLVAIDFTECSDAALDAAFAIASRLKAGLKLVHVVETPRASPSQIVPSTFDPGTIHDAQSKMAELVERANDHGLEARARVVLGGSVVLGLLDEIESAQPAIVIVGSHGKGILRRTLLGSVSEALCRRSSRPVLVIPSPRRRALAKEVARSCEACGYMLEPGHSLERCSGCGVSPVRWLTAPVLHGPIDFGENTVGDGAEDRLPYERTNDPTGMFATSPGGAEGYDVNPELRIRY